MTQSGGSRNFMWSRFRTVARCLVFFATICPLLFGCLISSYRPLLNETPLDPNVQQARNLSYFYYAGSTFSSHSYDSALLKQVLGEYLTPEAVVASVPPERGLYIRVYQTLSPRSPTIFEKLSQFSLAVIPYYSDAVEYTVDYDLYIDTVLKKTYRYELRQKRLIWIGALPFFWVNFLTNHHANAFTAPLHQFIRDARNEGLL
jgi:hypothetical protein